ncbi:hypothetical protein SAMN04487969_13438 [Paenibacillus algorifonticola]|uniref:Uncharacterized protein n=1 Tax=Paenibacillus algorifonticola TaxID=684063 RepID=A0A1I2IDE9_9BACL|nr:hypothetical protein [Paenibacillus algorifonticola]SFF40412.1 hypothetical protein SAMN04487969_13438 [Paenibacillus algorifonticola]
MNVNFGDIVAGERVGKYKLGSSLEELLEVIESPYVISESSNTINIDIDIDNIHFFVSKKTGELSTITVFGDYKGKYLSKICIGSTLMDLEDLDIEDLEYDSMENEYNMQGLTFCFSLKNEQGDRFLEHMVIWKSIE